MIGEVVVDGGGDAGDGFGGLGFVAFEVLDEYCEGVAGAVW